MPETGAFLSEGVVCMIRLTPRLQMTADLVTPCENLADIGTDHAYLPVYLIACGKVRRALACDRRLGPLENAARTVAEHGLEDRIFLRLSDGLKNVSPDEADAVTVAGMGGLQMAGMILDTLWLKSEGKLLVLQPMTHCEDVRRSLVENGFEILKEATAREGGRLYLGLSARYGGKSVPCKPWYAYTGHLIYSDRPTDRALCDRIIGRLEKKCAALKGAGRDFRETERILEEIKNEQRKRDL